MDSDAFPKRVSHVPVIVDKRTLLLPSLCFVWTRACCDGSRDSSRFSIEAEYVRMMQDFVRASCSLLASLDYVGGNNRLTMFCVRAMYFSMMMSSALSCRKRRGFSRIRMILRPCAPACGPSAPVGLTRAVTTARWPTILH